MYTLHILVMYVGYAIFLSIGIVVQTTVTFVTTITTPVTATQGKLLYFAHNV